MGKLLAEEFVVHLLNVLLMLLEYLNAVQLGKLLAEEVAALRIKLVQPLMVLLLTVVQMGK